MKAIFTSTPKDGKFIFENTVDTHKYCLENEGVELTHEIYPTAKISEKQKMFNYLFGPLMETSVQAYTYGGWPGMDNVKVRYLLQCEFAKEEMATPDGEIITYPIDLKKMDKARLLKFIQDIIFHLESVFGFSAPDSVKYKMMKLTGRNFTTVKNKDKWTQDTNQEDTCK